MGVVVRRYIDILTIMINFPYPTCIIWQQHPYFFVHFLNVFSFLILLFLYKRYSKNIRDRSKKINRDHANIIASGASYLVCSMAALSIYIYIYIYNRTCVIP